MGIFGNLDGTFRSRFSIGKKASEVYLERDGSNNLTLRDLVVTTAQKLNDLISRTRADQFSGLSSKGSPVSADRLLIEDSAASWAKKYTTVGSLPAGAAALPAGYVDGLKVSYVSASQVSIAIGRCRSDDNTTDIVSTGTLTANIATSGANGLDTGSEASDTWYSVWIIWNSGTGTAASLLSASMTSPTLPSGYTKKRRVGVVRNYGSNFLLFTQIVSEGRAREYIYDQVSENVLEVLTNGGATSWTNVDLSSFVSPTSTTALIRVMFYGTDAPGGHVSIRPDNTSISNPVTMQFAGTNSSEFSSSNSVWRQPTSSSQIIEYESTDAFVDVYIWVEGFIDII